MGSGVARNTGLEVADGEYIIYCDGDDWVDPDMYEKLYIKAREDNADIVMCDYYEEKQGKRIRCSQNPFRHKGNIVEQMLVGNSIPVYVGLWSGEACMRIIIFSFLLG